VISFLSTGTITKILEVSRGIKNQRAPGRKALKYLPFREMYIVKEKSFYEFVMSQLMLAY